MSMVQRAMPRRTLLSLFGSLLLGSVLAGLPACHERSKADEALEELRDEAEDAKDELEDEIDDHT